MAKFTIEFPDEVTELLDRLAAREGISRAEVIRRALALYNYAQQETVVKKHKLSITDDQDKILRDIKFD